jgi:hypothetical protein
MERAISKSEASRDPIATARLHALLRFTAGTTVAFIASEAMGWAPTFLAPVLVAVLLASLPAAPPLKVGLGLVLVMAVAAGLAFVLSSLLQLVPIILTGLVGVLIFVAFEAMAQQRAKLPATLLLLCMATIPVIALTAPAYAAVLPKALVRSMAVAVVLVWAVYAAWPCIARRPPQPAAVAKDEPIKMALVGTAVVMPVMLAHLLFGLADALPVLVTVVLLVATFDIREGATESLVKMLGNLVGGLIAIVAFIVLAVFPSLLTLGLITVVISAFSAARIAKGGAQAAVALMTFNSALIVLSTAIGNPSASSGVWLTRLFQFGLACVFATAMMTLIWGNKGFAPKTQANTR